MELIQMMNYVSIGSFHTWQKKPFEQKIAHETIYVHSKLAIADDRLAIIGSSNINDRSLLGDRDSEVAILVEGAWRDQRNRIQVKIFFIQEKSSAQVCVGGYGRWRWDLTNTSWRKWSPKAICSSKTFGSRRRRIIRPFIGTYFEICQIIASPLILTPTTTLIKDGKQVCQTNNEFKFYLIYHPILLSLSYFYHKYYNYFISHLL